MADKIQVKCSVCGKTYELNAGTKSADFVTKFPDRAKCPECWEAGGTNAAKATAKAVEAKNAAAGKPTTKTYGKQFKEITPADLHKAYEEVKAEFADILDEVAPYMGGWATTIALNKAQKGA